MFLKKEVVVSLKDNFNSIIIIYELCTSLPLSQIDKTGEWYKLPFKRYSLLFSGSIYVQESEGGQDRKLDVFPKGIGTIWWQRVWIITAIAD